MLNKLKSKFKRILFLPFKEINFCNDIHLNGWSQCDVTHSFEGGPIKDHLSPIQFNLVHSMCLIVIRFTQMT